MLSTLAIGGPAFAANEFPPNAVLTANSGCEGDTFHLHTTLSNPTVNQATAVFMATATNVNDGAGPVTFDVSFSVDPNNVRELDWLFVEGVPGSVHITSSDGNPAINYLFEVTPDCVPEVTTTVATTVPVTTVPAAIPATPTTVPAQLVPTALPETGSSNSTAATLAFGLLGVGILMLRFTRRAN